MNICFLFTFSAHANNNCYNTIKYRNKFTASFFINKIPYWIFTVNCTNCTYIWSFQQIMTKLRKMTLKMTSHTATSEYYSVNNSQSTKAEVILLLFLICLLGSGFCGCEIWMSGEALFYKMWTLQEPEGTTFRKVLHSLTFTLNT